MPRHYPSLEYNEFIVVEIVYLKHDDSYKYYQYYVDDKIDNGESAIHKLILLYHIYIRLGRSL